MQIFLGILLLLMSIFLVVAILFQQGKSHRRPGSIAGGAETFFGKAKGSSLNAKLSMATTVVAIVFVLVVIVVYILTGAGNSLFTSIDSGNNTNVSDDADVTDVDDGTVSDDAADDSAESTDGASETTDDSSSAE